MTYIKVKYPPIMDKTIGRMITVVDETLDKIINGMGLSAREQGDQLMRT